VVLLARALAWAGSRLGRGLAMLLLLPVKIVVGIARLLALVARGLGRAFVFILRIPFVVLRRVALGAGAVAVPALALGWGLVRYFAAGVAAVLRGIAIALAFLGRLAGRGVVALFVGILVSIRSLALGIFACVRALARAILWVALLPFRAGRLLAIGLFRVARLVAEAVGTVAMGLVALVRGVLAVLGLGARAVGRAARSVGTVLATTQPQYAACLPLAVLAVLCSLELAGPGAFPFATLGLLLLGMFTALALLPRPTGMIALLLSWGLAVAAIWRAEAYSLATPIWVDALVYLTALAALRSAYVAARTFVRETPVARRDVAQERAHRRASRAIGIVILVQCAAFAFWSANGGTILGAPLFGELLLVGAGLALAWVVRSGYYVRTAQAVLTLATLAALVGVIATQLKAFAVGQLYTTVSIGAMVLMLLVTAALTVVVHTRLIEESNG